MQKKEIVIKLPKTWETQIKSMADSEIANYLYNVIRNGYYDRYGTCKVGVIRKTRVQG